MNGTKYDDDKPRLNLLPFEALEEVALVLNFGAKKYGDWNWKGGFKYGRLSAAAMRHLFAWSTGEDKDPESGYSHLAHAACCVLFLLDFVKSGKYAHLDNRYKPENEVVEVQLGCEHEWWVVGRNVLECYKCKAVKEVKAVK